MITKSIVKDYVHRKCPYLAKAALDDNSLLKLIESYLEFGSKEDIEETILESDDGDDNENPNEDQTLDIVEIMRDYPYLRGDIEKLIIKHAQENPLYGLLKKYEDTQVTAKLSRRFIELIYGNDVCERCDVNDFGVESLNQSFIVSKTKECLSNPKIKVLFEGQIEYQNLRARFDVLVKNDDGSFTIVEAKGSNSVFKHSKNEPEIDTGIKEAYLYDLAFQYYIYEKAGLNISSLGYLYLNRDYKYSNDLVTYPNLSDEEIKNLFKITYSLNYKKPRSKVDPIEVPVKAFLDEEFYVEYDKDGEPKTLSIDEVVYRLEMIQKGITPKANKHYECVKGGKCPFLLACFEDAEDHNSLFKLTRWGLFGGSWTRSKKLIEEGAVVTLNSDNMIRELLNFFFVAESVLVCIALPSTCL